MTLALGISQSDPLPMTRPKPYFERMCYHHDEQHALRVLAERDELFVLLKQPGDSIEHRVLVAYHQETQWVEACAGEQDFWEPEDEDIDLGHAVATSSGAPN
jgi:hypothetical protein